jgi:hypothetical protein
MDHELLSLQVMLERLLKHLDIARRQLMDTVVPRKAEIASHWDTVILPDIRAWIADVGQAVKVRTYLQTDQCQITLRRLGALSKTFDLDLSWYQSEEEVYSIIPLIVQKSTTLQIR